MSSAFTKFIKALTLHLMARSNEDFFEVETWTDEYNANMMFNF